MRKHISDMPMLVQYQLIEAQVELGMTAGSSAAAAGCPITDCPFGVCVGVDDEFHEDVLISSWVIGWSEEMMFQAIDEHFYLGVEFSDIGDVGLEHMPGQFLPVDASGRIRTALVEGFTTGVIVGDFGGVWQ